VYIVTLNEFSNSSKPNGGSPNSSIASAAFSNPDPISSHMLYLLNADANTSFLDSGVVLISLSIFLEGNRFPGFVKRFRFY
tara:strand:+ start:2206 stop:2448 length:243 start_codon:yes stop_codon:yes gene_type:complete